MSTPPLGARCRTCGRGVLVVGKSTVPVGTARRLAAVVAGADCDLAWNPEFLREGHAVEDALRPDRVVLGVELRHAPERSSDGRLRLRSSMPGSRWS